MKTPTPAQLLKQQRTLDIQYVVDGRHLPSHPFHMTYSGLGTKYHTHFEALQEDWATDETITQEEES